jgi:PiT family inorganic phosphate transporter
VSLDSKPWKTMLAHILPSSAAVIALLVGCFVLVLAFEATNGFHDTSNAVATVIYTNTLKPVPAVMWSGVMNFVGVMVGGIAVAYALVEILPPDVLTPPDGAPALPMLIALFVSALFWNVLTWGFGIPNSSSHCIIGALIGVACGDAIMRHRALSEGVDWQQIRTVLEGLAISPVLGLVLAGGLYGLLRLVVRRGHLFEPPEKDQPPVWWLRCLLVLTCTSVSFSHGTNDGQKSIGLIMLTIIGLLPATFALNPHSGAALQQLPADARAAIPLIQQYGDDRKQAGIQAAKALESFKPSEATWTLAQAPDAVRARTERRGDVYSVISQLRHVGENPAASEADKAKATALRKQMGPPVQFAPIWVRVLSAFCLGAGTMIGYKRVVRTLGERLGKSHMTPGQGGSAELVGSILIGLAGFTGLPVSTTHVVTAGIAGTMIAGGQGIQRGMVVRIVAAWVFTLPATILISGILFYALANPGL